MTQREKIADTYEKLKELPENDLAYISGGVNALLASQRMREAERKVDADDIPKTADDG